jgi:hemoglobin-like flavoprotein
MISHDELIASCLELVAEKCEDLAPEVYRRFFARFPDGEDLFGIDPDNSVKGGMIVSLLMEVMNFSEGRVYSDNVLRWIGDHKSYGVTYPMYEVMFDTLLAVIADVLGDSWTPAMDDAWRAQYDILLPHIKQIYGIT